MPRFKLFARKQADGTSVLPTGEWHPTAAGSHPSAGAATYDDLPGDPQEDDPLLAEAAGAGDPPTEQLFDDPSEPVATGGARKYLDLVQPPPPEETASGAFDTDDEEADDADPVAIESVLTLPLPDAKPLQEQAAAFESKTLIGGREEDLVPLIPNTDADIETGAEPDDDAVAPAAVEALQGACALLVARTNKIRTVKDTTQMVAGLIAVINELDALYATDWGIVRRDGLAELLVEVRRSMAEGDRFILESLENGRGGLTADAFQRDLKTIAPSDRPRMIGHYVTFLTFVITCVLHQYLRPLEDEPRTRELTYRLDYLVDGVRDVLLARVTGRARS